MDRPAQRELRELLMTRRFQEVVKAFRRLVLEVWRLCNMLPADALEVNVFFDCLAQIILGPVPNALKERVTEKKA